MFIIKKSDGNQQKIDGDGFYIMNNTLIIYQELSTIQEGMEAMIEVFGVVPTVQKPIAAFAPNQWSSIYEQGDFETVH